MFTSRGNIKVKCPIFNLPTGITCKPGLSCRGYCYAKKAETRFPKIVNNCRNLNLLQSTCPDFVEHMIHQLLSIKDKPYMRIHESGDFYNREYILKWYKIIRHLNTTRFFAYTKRDDLFSEDLLKQKPVNLTLIYSLDGIDPPNTTHKKGFDKIAYTSSTETNCEAQMGDALCMRDCFRCVEDSNFKTIVFKKH